jgi:5'-deoxynucleotidase YfbR-like HD superfamily hydrolase
VVTRDDVRFNPRLAGLVKRYHTWPVLQPQTVAEHTWQVLRIWYSIWGAPSREVFSVLLWHDAGEVANGDLPFPAKSENPALKEIMDGLEHHALIRMGGGRVLPPDLSPKQNLAIKVCDLIEMLEYGMHERRLGNVYAEPIVADVGEALLALRKKAPDLGWVAIEEYLKRVNIFVLWEKGERDVCDQRT